MSDTAVRYLTMLRMVPRYPRAITTRELAMRLEDRKFPVTMRSIQRDLEKLSAYFPLQVDETARPYRWSFDPEASLDLIPALDGPAALTYELTRNYLKPILPEKAKSYLRPYLDDAQKAETSAESPFRKWLDRVRIINWNGNGARTHLDIDVLEAVTEALITEQQCRLLYPKEQGSVPEVVLVNPLGVIFKDAFVYLVGTIEGQEGIQQLALEYASDASVVKTPVHVPYNFDIDLYIHSGAMGTLKSKEPVALHLHCDKPALSEVETIPLGSDQVISHIDDNGFEVRVTVGDTEELRWWLTARAIHCDVLQPQWLRREIEESLKASLDRIQSKS